MDTATSKQLASVSAWSSILWQGAGFRSCHGSRRCAGEDSGSWPKKQPNDLRVAREKDQKYGNREITRESSEPRLKKNKSWAGGAGRCWSPEYSRIPESCQATEVQGLAPQDVTLALARSKRT